MCLSNEVAKEIIEEYDLMGFNLFAETEKEFIESFAMNAGEMFDFADEDMKDIGKRNIFVCYWVMAMNENVHNFTQNMINPERGIEMFHCVEDAFFSRLQFN